MQAVRQMSRNTYHHSRAGTFSQNNFTYSATHMAPGK